MGHSNIKPTMDVDGKVAGKMAPSEERAARLDSMAMTTAATLVSTWSAGDSKTGQKNQNQPEDQNALSA